MLGENLFSQIGIVFILATFVGLAVRLLKQPLTLAYIFTGIGLGALAIAAAPSEETLSLLSQFGVAFLLFMVGLELKIGDLKQIGRNAIVVGFGQVTLTFAVSFMVALNLGFNSLAAIYIALALSFSSTIIVIKLLSEKGELDSLQGKFTIGLLLVQDLVAILVLMFLTSFKTQAIPNPTDIAFVLVKAVVFFILVLIFSRRFVPFVFRLVARNQELLFLTAVSWCFLFALTSVLLGFSIEVGAFIAGVSLSSLPYHYQISSRIRPLRDLFVVLFFVGLGMQMDVVSGFRVLVPVIVFSVLVLGVKPAIVFFLMSFSGFRKRTSFLTSTYLGQVSEFSLILMAIGQGLGHLEVEATSAMIGTGIVTIITSTYLILWGRIIYQRTSAVLSLFERGSSFEKSSLLAKPPEDHVILIGCHRTGSDILAFLKKWDHPYLVLDFNPEVISRLETEGIPCLFGDVSDEEILSQLNLAKAKILVSTVGKLEDNLVLVSKAKNLNEKVIILATAFYQEEEEALYKAGVDYVVMPHLLGGKHVAHLLSEHEKDLGKYLYAKRQNAPESRYML